MTDSDGVYGMDIEYRGYTRDILRMPLDRAYQGMGKERCEVGLAGRFRSSICDIFSTYCTFDGK